jgi:hypothetical protein
MDRHSTNTNVLARSNDAAVVSNGPCELYTRGAASRAKKKIQRGGRDRGEKTRPALATATAPRPDRDRGSSRRWRERETTELSFRFRCHSRCRAIRSVCYGSSPSAHGAPCRGNEEMNAPRRSACAGALRPAAA